MGPRRYLLISTQPNRDCIRPPVSPVGREQPRTDVVKRFAQARTTMGRFARVWILPPPPHSLYDRSNSSINTPNLPNLSIIVWTRDLIYCGFIAADVKGQITQIFTGASQHPGSQESWFPHFMVLLLPDLLAG